MLGYILYGDGPQRPELGERQIAGVTFVTLRMGRSRHPDGLLARRRAGKWAGQLRALGVRTAVFPVDFPYSSLFIRQGIAPVDTLPLRRALAVPLTRRRLRAMGLEPTRAVAAVCGDRAAGEAAEAARTLALNYRYVMLSVRDGGEVLAGSLRREYGVSLLLSPGREQLDRADALLLFVPRPDLAGENRIFYTLYPGGETGRGKLPLCLPPALESRLEPNCGREQLAAALYSLGALTAEQILAEIPC